MEKLDEHFRVRRYVIPDTFITVDIKITMSYKQTGKRSATAVAKKTEVLIGWFLLGLLKGSLRQLGEVANTPALHARSSSSRRLTMYKGKRLFSARVAATAGTTVGAQVYQHNAMKLSPAQKILSHCPT